MRILVVGASGDIGQAICAELKPRHEIITAGRSSGDHQVDLTDLASVQALYQTVGPVDAVISAVGEVKFATLAEFTPDQMLFGLQNKVMGQINLVLAGLNVVRDGGSLTLTSGILDRDPVAVGVGAATANAALGGFVKGAAIDMPRGLRLNVVSPGLLDVSAAKYGQFFPGHVPVAATRVGLAYAKCVEGLPNGQVVIVDG